MLPFVQRQLVYALASALLTAAIWWGLGRNSRLAPSPRLRTLAAGSAVAGISALCIIAARALDHWHSTYQFMGIAFGFYAGLFWLPAAALMRLASERKRGVARDPWLAAACLVLVLVGTYALVLEPNRLVVARHEITLDSWPQGSAPLRVVHVSDLQTVGPCARNRRAAEKVAELEPDLVVVTGDYVAGPFGRDEVLVDEARAFLASLRPALAVVCVAGHSEPESLRGRIFEGLDLIYLQNEEVELELGDGRRLRLFGVTALDPELETFEVRREPGLVTLFVSHVPDLTRELDGLGVDLHLAGHTHGGQVALPFLGAPLTLSELPRRYARGLHRYGDHWLNVNAGIGMEGNHAPRFRFLSPPQIDLILLDGSGATPGGTRGGGSTDPGPEPRVDSPSK